MKKKILNKYPQSLFITTKFPNLYVADFRKRTINTRGVEISEVPQNAPDNLEEEMPSFVFHNPNRQAIDYNIFDDNQFKDKFGNVRKHGEGCFLPNKSDGRSWFCILEIKDCPTYNMGKYNQEVFEKMDSMHDIFRKEIGIPNNIYFIVSFPQKKTAFNQTIYEDYVNKKNLKKNFMIASNSATIIDNHILDPYK